jgi:hypothetical protein
VSPSLGATERPNNEEPMSNFTASIRVALTMTAILVLAACGGAAPADAPGADAPGPAEGAPADDPPAGSTGAAHACDLVGADEVSSALAVDVANVDRDTGEVGTYCRFYADSGFPLLTVGLDRDHPDLWEITAAADGAVDVSGLADRAVISVGTLHFMVGDTTVSLATTGPAGDTADNIDALRELATLIIDRL